MGARIELGAVGRAALRVLPNLLRRWLPDGRIQGSEYVALNPTRIDCRPGSFKLNIRIGKWANFSTGDRGSDVISLATYLSGKGQAEAALALAATLGVHHG